MRPDDGGFESGGIGTPWGSFGFYAAFQQQQVYAGAWAMEFRSNGSGGGSVVYQSVPTTLGESLMIVGAYRADSNVSPDSRLDLYADLVGGNPALIDSFGIADIGSQVWTPRFHGPVVAQASQVEFLWQATAGSPSEPTASWYLDSIAIAGSDDVAKRSRWLAHQRLVQVLKGINGAAGGYHLDLGNRVFTKYIRPVGSTHPALPYLCVPLVNTAPRVDHDNTHLKHTWTLPIMAFVAEPNVGAYDSDAIAALYHLGEDVYRAVMQDPTLNNTVAPISFVSGGVEEGGISPFDGLPYADAVIPIDLSIYLGLDVLGP